MLVRDKGDVLLGINGREIGLNDGLIALVGLITTEKYLKVRLIHTPAIGFRLLFLPSLGAGAELLGKVFPYVRPLKHPNHVISQT